MASNSPINWELCCLCQSNTATDDLQTAKEDGCVSLEKDLKGFEANNCKLPVQITITPNQLDDGPGIAATLKLHKGKYHKSCRSYCSSSRLKRAIDSLEKTSLCEQRSPKKLRSGGSENPEAHDRYCVICGEEEASQIGGFHKVKTDNVDTNIRKWAKTTKNFPILGRLAVASDAHAADAYYHHKCYTRLRNDSEALEKKESEKSATYSPFDPMVCAEIVALIENSDTTSFKLSELCEMYRTLMKQQGRPCSNEREPHSTRFKDYLLSLLPSWMEVSGSGKGKKVVFLSHKTKMADDLARTYKSEIGQEDALIFMRAAVMMHKYCLQTQDAFDGSFPSNCLTSAVNEQMRSFFNVVLCGQVHETIADDADLEARDKIACSISQLLIYNVTKGTHHKVKTSTIRHSKEHETPFPLYHGLKLHGQGRNKKQIDTDHEQGISVSYTRVMEVKRDIARAVCARHAKDGVVVPTNSRQYVFTTHDVDNIDSKAQGNFSSDEFHGYALSVTNHLSSENHGVIREPIKIDSTDTRPVKLPDAYLIQSHVDIGQSDVIPPENSGEQVRPSFNTQEAEHKDETWMAHVHEIIDQDRPLGPEDIITWSGYNSTKLDDDSVKPPAEIGVYPLLPYKAASAPSMKHAMELAMHGTEFLNPGQTCVLGADQPLYTIIKQLQWKYPDSLGEDKLVAMMGALHIEDKMHLMAGKLLEDSGWTTILSQAEVLTSGRAQSALNEHHIKRTRYAHQVTLMSLYILKHRAYQAAEDQFESFDLWNQAQSDPMFRYWSMIMKLELTMCRFIRSLREGDFHLYVQTIDELCPWFHVLDHTNYARWLPVHVRDMVQLPKKHPEVYAEFMNGNFVVQKSAKKFSMIAKDQSHEQSNKCLQAHGGAVGLYENPDALALFMLAGPDCSRIVEEFERVYKHNVDSSTHHEEEHSMQIKYKKDVESFVQVMEKLGNPFLPTGPELVAIDTQSVMEQAVVNSLCQVYENGQNFHDAYVKERLVDRMVPISNTIKRKSIFTFANRPDTRQKGRKDAGVQKQNMTLITQLFLSLQARPDSNVIEFFRYENQREPPSLADRGMLRTGTKSDILQCITTQNDTTPREAKPVVVLDMAAVVNMVRPTNVKTFNEYVDARIVPFIESQVATHTERVDAIWDNYPEDNLKNQTQRKRGNGARTRVGDGNTPIPKSEWSNFLRNEENKKELFPFISRQLVKMDTCLLLSTHLQSVLANKPYDLTTMQPCNHTEADTKIFLHLADARSKGHNRAYIRTVDSDIVVLAAYFFQELGLTELWVGFGCGKKYRDIPVHIIAKNLGQQKCLALLLFHSLTGCDTTSAFLGCGKKTAWTVWNAMPELTDTLINLTANPELFTMDSSYMQQIERFVVLMYSKGCGSANVDEARCHLFTTGKKMLDGLPPTRAALYQHVKRSLLQVICWKQATSKQQDIPSFADWGWVKESNIWQPLWTTLSDASKECEILLKCSCHKACSGMCKCSRAGLRCTRLCYCEGGCINNQGEDN